VDPLAEESLALAGISAAAVQGRVAFGPRAGARVLQLGREPDAPWVTSRGPRQAHLEGFDLHADIAVPTKVVPPPDDHVVRKRFVDMRCYQSRGGGLTQVASGSYLTYLCGPSA